MQSVPRSADASPLNRISLLVYAISFEGTKPVTEKQHAIRVWPEVLTNKTGVLQFLGTRSCCGMFMDPDSEGVSRPRADLIR